MKFHLVVLLCFTFFFSSAQSRKRGNDGNTWRIVSSFNTIQSFDHYSLKSQVSNLEPNYILEFITPTSGEFEIVYEEVIQENIFTLRPPSNTLRFGLGIQKIKSNGLSHQFTLTGLNWLKYENFREFRFRYDEENLSALIREGQNVNLFQTGFNYELSKYFGRLGSKSINFELGMIFQNNFTYYKTKPFSLRGTATRASIYNLNVGLITALQKSFSKSISIELKAFPSFHIFMLKKIKENSAFLFESQKFEYEGELPEFIMGASLEIKYTFSSPLLKRKGRRG